VQARRLNLLKKAPMPLNLNREKESASAGLATTSGNKARIASISQYRGARPIPQPPYRALGRPAVDTIHDRRSCG